jgi:hypothetical protein
MLFDALRDDVMGKITRRIAAACSAHRAKSYLKGPGGAGTASPVHALGWAPRSPRQNPGLAMSPMLPLRSRELITCLAGRRSLSDGYLARP